MDVELLDRRELRDEVEVLVFVRCVSIGVRREEDLFLGGWRGPRTGIRLGVALVPGVGAVTMTFVGPVMSTRTLRRRGPGVASSVFSVAVAIATRLGVLQASSKRLWLASFLRRPGEVNPPDRWEPILS
jgi:hypothetical protein